MNQKTYQLTLNFDQILDLVKQNYFEKGTKILCIHTGGLQGIEGINRLLKQKDQIEIKTYD